ncbi:hypothetical protein KUV57_12085 [Epibacterium sp. DP7N7-1]|nr:hypothetical protein [Epibacterium sp. DP7N7-1]
MSGRPFYSTCVNWPPRLMTAKEWLDERADEIDYARFCTLVDADNLTRIETGLGYTDDRPMSGDPHISYHLDEHSGIPYFVWSAIEHVFAAPEEIEALERHALDQEFLSDEGILVIDRIGRMAGKAPDNPDFEGDLQDETLEKIIGHSGTFILIEDDVVPPAYVTATLERALSHAGATRVARINASGPHGPASEQDLKHLARERSFNGSLQWPGIPQKCDVPSP